MFICVHPWPLINVFWLDPQESLALIPWDQEVSDREISNRLGQTFGREAVNPSTLRYSLRHRLPAGGANHFNRFPGAHSRSHKRTGGDEA